MTHETILDLLAESARTHGFRAALLAPGRDPLSFEDLASQALIVARRLRESGIGPADRVAVVLPNGPDLAAAFLGVAAAAACAPLNPAFTAAQFEFYLKDLGARALVALASGGGPAHAAARALGIPVLPLRAGPRAGEFDLSLMDGDGRGARPRPYDEPQDGAGRVGTARTCGEPGDIAWPAPDDASLLLHTSGTTSRPKLVVLSGRNLTASAAHIASTLALTPDDRCLNIMPLFHVHGLMAAVLASLHAGASVVCTSGIYAAGFFDWMHEFRPTWYTAVPTMHQGILTQVRANPALADGSSFRFIRSSSAALPVTVLEELERTFRTPVIEAYGMTEASHQMASNPLPPRARKPGSVGIAAGPDVAIMGSGGELLRRGEIGEVVIRGPNVTTGYDGDEATTRAAFTNGWFRTGDQGRLDEDGYLYLTGRLKELINRGGEKIAPREVDDVLLQHPLVRQAVCFAVPHVQLGEDVGAAIELQPGAQLSASDLRQWAAARLPTFRVPRIVRFVDRIPTGPTGKLQRAGLAQTLGIDAVDDAQRSAERVEARNPTERSIASIWRQMLPQGPSFGVRDRFEALGGDSLLAATMLTAVGVVHGVDVAPSRFVEEGTVEALAADVAASPRRDEAELVLLNPQAAGTPLYWVPGHDGGLLGIGRLVHAMRDDSTPVWTLNLRAMPAADRIEALAAHGISLLRAQGSGPYRLGGSCFGGVVAVEMARQLTEAGEQVEFLAAVDAMYPRWRAKAGRLGVARALARQLLTKLRRHTTVLRRQRVGDAAAYVARRARSFVQNHGQTAAAQLRLYRSRGIANRGLALRYAGGPYDGAMLLIVVRGRRPDVPALGWHAVVRGSLEVVSLPITLEAAMSDENLPALAEALRTRLQSHSRGSGAPMAPAVARS